jgi:predicted permease
MSDEPLWRRYRRFVRPDPGRDVDDEIAFHLEMRMDEYQRTGRSSAEARAEAMQRFGNVDAVLDECHDIGRHRARRGRRRWRWQSFTQDVRVGLRGLASNRGFALGVILTMAIGIGANAAVFSVAYGVLLRALPYHDPDALVRLWSRNVPRGVEFFSVSSADFREWRSQNRAFTTMAALERQRDVALRRGGEAEVIQAARVMPEVFSLLGTEAQLGRRLSADDARPGVPATAVLGYDLWQSRFGSDTTIIGRDVSLDGASVTIVGVMPPRFFIPGAAALVWEPLSIDAAPDDHSNRSLRVLGRLAPGVTLERARADLEVITARLAREHPSSNEGWTINMLTVNENIVGTQFRRAVLVLMGVVGFVLLIACANAANLQLARASARRREMALRAALGASRGRIVTQLLTESALLSVIAGIAGLALAYAGIVLLRDVGTTTIPRLDDVRLDAPVLVFTIVTALGCSVLFGLVPALQASRADVGEVLKEGGRGGDGGRGGRRVRSTLVVAEIAVSLMLLVGAGLLLRSFARLQAVDVGFDPRGTVVVPLQLPGASYQERERVAGFYAEVLARVRVLPGVTDAAVVSGAPFAGPNTGLSFVRTDRPVDPGLLPDADLRVITPGLLRTLRIALLQGRDFSPADSRGAPTVALVNQAMARRYWPNENPIGLSVRLGDPVQGTVYTIVGVVGDVRYYGLDAPEMRPMIYLAVDQAPRPAMSLVIRTTSPSSLAAAVRRAVSAVDPALPPPSLINMEEVIEQTMSTRRFALVLLAIFAGTAVVLAIVGIYSVMAYAVRQQRRELGIRVALGAPRRSLVARVVGHTARLAAVGVVLGTVGAILLADSLSTLLFGVAPTDPLTFAAVAVLLATVAVMASLVPAWSAMRADPMVALHSAD